MKFPMFKVHIDEESAIRELRKTLNSGYLNEGEQVRKFTSFFSNYLEEENVVMTNSCTSALTLSLILSDVKPGDEVITTSMTCLATNTPIINVGGTVVWADINKKTGCIDPESVRLKITEKTKAVICVNWAGIPCELEKLKSICEENNIKLIQDAAHGMGSRYKDRSIVKFADYTCFSFQAIKHITTGDGGAIICRDKKDYNRCKKLKWFGLDRESTKDEKGEWKGQRWEVDVIEAGYKFHMNNITAAIGLSQIEYFDNIVLKHKENAKAYNSAFSGNINIRLLEINEHSDPSYWVYTMLLNEDVDRDKVLKLLNAQGVNAGLVHVPNHNYTCFRASYIDLPSTDYFHKHQISLPCGWWLDNKDITEIVEIVTKKVQECKI
jgi:dTDP-4-amino-4,6-dideoxygalactose transaminase